MASEPNKEGLELLLERIQDGERRAAENYADIVRLHNDKFEVIVQTISEVNTKLRNQIKLIGRKLEVFDNNITQNDLLFKLKLNQLDKKMNNFIATNEDVLSSTEDILDSEKSAHQDGTRNPLDSYIRKLLAKVNLYSASMPPVLNKKAPDLPNRTKKTNQDSTEDILASEKATDQDGTENVFDGSIRRCHAGVKSNPSVSNENVPDRPNRMPLHISSTKDIVNKGADVNAPSGRTLLMHAAFRGYTAVVKYLLSKGANVNHQDQHLDTPLHYAVRGNNLDVVKVLMENGADKTLTNMEHCTALDEAMKSYIYIRPTLPASVLKLTN